MIDDKLPSLCQTLLRGQGKVSSPRHSCLCSISICQGPARGRDAARRAGCSRLPEACGRSSEWQGCVLQGLLNVMGWAAGRIMTPFSDATVRFSGEKWKRCQGPLPLPGQQVSRLEKVLGEDKETCVCREDVPQSHRDSQTRGGASHGTRK